jgi:hypothetical protein
MRRIVFTSLIILAGLLTNYAWPQSIKPTVVGQKVSLVSGEDTITYVELINTHSRIYEDSISRSRLTADEKNKGVFWKIQCVGAKMDDPFDKIILRDEKGSKFIPVTNVIQTAGNSKAYDKNGNVIYDGPSTTFFFLGPDDSKAVQIQFGNTSVKIMVGK